MKYTAIDNMEIGTVLTLVDGTIRLAEAEHNHFIVGMAARKIKKGEVIEYSPIKNTADVVVEPGYFNESIR